MRDHGSMLHNFRPQPKPTRKECVERVASRRASQTAKHPLASQRGLGIGLGRSLFSQIIKLKNGSIIQVTREDNPDRLVDGKEK